MNNKTFIIIKILIPIIIPFMVVLVIVFASLLTNRDDRDYCSECIVRKTYTLYKPSFYKENPFEKNDSSIVIITDKQNGYVQYCYKYEYELPDKLLYTRSCKEFIGLTHNKIKK